MKRKVITIDEDKCIGCGLCANACQEGAIGIVDGKAKLLRDDYCDGLGNCLPVCPVDAISFEEREAAAFDKAAAEAHKKEIGKSSSGPGCAGEESRVITHGKDPAQPVTAGIPQVPQSAGEVPTQLNQWPVQIKLVMTQAPFFDNAKLLIAADCAAYAYGNFHQEYMKGRITLIGCPKLDDVDYSQKLTDILTNNNIKSVTIVRMEVPCCGGLENAAVLALKNCGKMIPWQVVTLSTDGSVNSNQNGNC